LWRRLARYGGRPEPSALNVSLESLKLIRETIGSQYKWRSIQTYNETHNHLYDGPHYKTDDRQTD